FFCILLLSLFSSLPPQISTLFPYTTLFRSPTPHLMMVRPPTAAHQEATTTFSPTAPSHRTPWFLPTPTKQAAARSSTRSFPASRSEEHTSELQSRFDIVCRLLLEIKKDT